MVVFFNPFMKHDVSDFPDVYVPLEQTRRNPSVVEVHDEKLGIDDKALEVSGSPKPNYGANTLEGLRAEIESGMRRALKFQMNLRELTC